MDNKLPLQLQNFAPATAADAEAALLSCFLLHPSALAPLSSRLSPEDFYRPHHRAMFRVIHGLIESGEPLDCVTVLAAVEAEGAAEACGGSGYIRSLFVLDVSASLAGKYAALVLDAARKRTLTDGAIKVIETAHAGGSSQEIGQAVEALITNAPQEQISHSQTAREILMALTDKIDERSQNPQVMLGLSTGFAAIDQITNGLQAPDFIVIGARPGVGKSALMTRIASHNAALGVPVIIFSMEMSNEQTGLRMACAEAQVSSHLLRSGRLRAHEYDAYADAVNLFYSTPLVINDRSGATPGYMRTEIRHFIRRYGRVGLVCVDYLQLMRPDGRGTDRYKELTEISIELKAIAREFNAPLLALSQLSRESVKRESKRPVLSDIRETGQIEQDADIVAFLHRDDMFLDKAAPVYDGPDAPPSIVPAELIFRKHRNGPQGVVKLDFVEQFALFTDPA